MKLPEFAGKRVGAADRVTVRRPGHASSITLYFLFPTSLRVKQNARMKTSEMNRHSDERKTFDWSRALNILKGSGVYLALVRKGGLPADPNSTPKGFPRMSSGHEIPFTVPLELRGKRGAVNVASEIPSPPGTGTAPVERD